MIAICVVLMVHLHELNDAIGWKIKIAPAAHPLILAILPS
jgi:hypothetical protein